MASLGSRRGKILSEINMTPFVDIVLVLLIIFIISAPLMYSSFSVNVPSASFEQQNEKHNIRLEILKNGQIAISKGVNKPSGGNNVDKGQILQRIAALNINKDDTIYIIADGECKYQDVIQTVELLTKNGFKNLSLVTEG